MAVEIHPAAREHLADIAQLLREAFGVPPGAYFLDPDLLAWKYFTGPADAALPRSYILRHGGRAVAHCGAVPLTLASPGDGNGTPATRVPAIAFMDWAAGGTLPGAGIILKKKLMALADVALVAGGTDDTRATLPRLGFEVRGEIVVFARVVRPLRQARARPRTALWRDAARAIRNTAWSLRPPGRIAPGWRAVPAADLASLGDVPPHPGTTPERTPAFLDYWLRCPAARMRAFELRHDGGAVGYFVLAAVGHQTRIVDLRVRAAADQDWVMAYRVATRAAAADPRTHEVTTAASVPALHAVLASCGFRARTRLPLFVSDPLGRLKGAPPLSWSFIDNDVAYLYDHRNPYAT